MKNFIKNNKVTVVAFIICVIFVVLVFAIKLTFFPNEGTAIYGDRLDGIEKVEITVGGTSRKTPERGKVVEIMQAITSSIKKKRKITLRTRRIKKINTKIKY